MKSDASKHLPDCPVRGLMSVDLEKAKRKFKRIESNQKTPLNVFDNSVSSRVENIRNSP